MPEIISSPGGGRLCACRYQENLSTPSWSEAYPSMAKILTIIIDRNPKPCLLAVWVNTTSSYFIPKSVNRMSKSIYTPITNYWFCDQNIMPENTKSITKQQMARHSKYRDGIFGTTTIWKVENDNFESIRFYYQMLLQNVRVCTSHSYSERGPPLTKENKYQKWFLLQITTKVFSFPFKLFLCWLRKTFLRGRQRSWQEV